MRTDDETVSIQIANRFFLYRYLWRAFTADPDASLVEAARSDYALQACALVGDEAARMQQAVAAALAEPEAARENEPEAARKAADGAGDPDRAGGVPLDAMKSAFTRLFVGPAALPAPPWESVYASGENLIFQKSTLDVRAAFREAGYQAAGYPHEADDHLATELDFMASLAERASAAYEEGDVAATRALLKTQRDFLEAHLGRWAGTFADRLEGCAATDAERVYARFARLCAILCAADAAALRELLVA